MCVFFFLRKLNYIKCRLFSENSIVILVLIPNHIENFLISCEILWKVRLIADLFPLPHYIFVELIVNI